MGALGKLLREVAASMGEGTWYRLKVCRKDACRWAFYDGSRNRSGTSCAMSICGNRVKGRVYRERHRPDARPS